MKILYVSTISNTINAFMIPHIELLLNHGHIVDIACNIDRDISQHLIQRGCKVFNIGFQRSPLRKQNYSAYLKLKKLIQDEKYDLVHTHTPVASALVRLACMGIKNVKVVYTAHGFHFFKGAPLKNWLFYYPTEKWLARYTNVLITINKEDYGRAKKFKAKKVEYISGVGLDTEKIMSTKVDDEKKREELSIPKDAFVVLSVGELNDNKNHETIIKSIYLLNNPNVYYIICGQGTLENHLKGIVKELGLGKQVKLLGYRSDIYEICKVSDVFAFPSKREGLGMAALEAMAAGLPIVTSNVHGIVDYSIDGVTGYSCSPTDVGGFAKAIKELINNYNLKTKMGQHNMKFVKNFDVENVKTKLFESYRDVLSDE